MRREEGGEVPQQVGESEEEEEVPGLRPGGEVDQEVSDLPSRHRCCRAGLEVSVLLPPGPETFLLPAGPRLRLC